MTLTGRSSLPVADGVVVRVTTITASEKVDQDRMA